MPVSEMVAMQITTDRCDLSLMFTREKLGPCCCWKAAECDLCHGTEFALVRGLICGLLRLCSCVSSVVEKLC